MGNTLQRPWTARRAGHPRPPQTDYNHVANQGVKPAPVFPESNDQPAKLSQRHPRQGAAELPAQPHTGAVRSQDASGPLGPQQCRLHRHNVQRWYQSRSASPRASGMWAKASSHVLKPKGRVRPCPASTIFAGWRQLVLPVHLLGLDALLGSVAVRPCTCASPSYRYKRK